MSTQHDEGDCPLCGGVGEVSISKDGTYEGTDYYGCPMCISRERDEEARLIETQRDELRTVNAGLVQAARQALEALEQLQGGCTDSNDGTGEAITVWCPEAITALREALEAAPEPAAVGQEPVALGPLAKRRVFDYIRGAYDLGYNDARNARAVPGDNAPGYKGRDVEVDHGGALFNALRACITAPQPARQPARQPLTDDWIRGLCKEAWVFDAAKQWIRIAERAHGIGGEA